MKKQFAKIKQNPVKIQQKWSIFAASTKRVMHANFCKKAMLVKRMVDQYYQPQSHRGCMRDIYRHKVVEMYPMSEPTFYRYMRYAIGVDGYIGNGSNRVEREKKPVPAVVTNQLSLF